MPEGHDLQRALRTAALELPSTHIRLLANVLAAYEAPTPSARATATAVVPTAGFRSAARYILDCWAATPGLNGFAVALGLSTAADAVEQLRATSSTEIVWTGPATAEVPVRLTRQVLVNLVRSARTSLILVSFAAYRVADLVAEIAAAATRDVDIRLVLEDAEVDGGNLSFAATGAFADLGSAVSFYHWPPADRTVNSSGGRASMHVKAGIADEHTCLVTSANLTGQAINLNMELGLLVRGGPVPARLSRHFRQLMVDGVLKMAAR